MRRKMIQGKTIYRLYKRTICAAVSVALLAAWPMAANSEEYYEDDVLLTDSFSEEPEAAWEDNEIGEESTDLFENFSIEEDIDQDAGFIEEDDTVEDLQDASSVPGAAGEAEAFLQEEAADEATSGECGAVEGTVFWELDEEGTLHISGEGEMADWDSPEDVPWANCSELIKELDIQDSITGIGSYAFSGCVALTAARIG